MRFQAHPLVHEIRADFGQIKPFEQDPIDRALAHMHHAYTVEGASEREAFCRGLEVVRDEIMPRIRTGKRPPSRKARRRVIGPWDRLIAEGRARNG